MNQKSQSTQIDMKWFHYARYGKKKRVREKYKSRLKNVGILMCGPFWYRLPPIQQFDRPYSYDFYNIYIPPTPWYLRPQRYFDVQLSAYGYVPDIWYDVARYQQAKED